MSYLKDFDSAFEKLEQELFNFPENDKKYVPEISVNSIKLTSICKFSRRGAKPSFLKAIKSRNPKKQLKIPVLGGNAYGLSILISLNGRFNKEIFSKMCSDLYGFIEGYSKKELEKYYKEMAFGERIKNKIEVGFHKILANLFFPSLLSYKVSNEGQIFGLRLVNLNEKYYVNFSGQIKDYKRTYLESRKICEYLDNLI